MRLGLQIPNFTYPDVPPDRLFDTVATAARTAETSGFDTVMVMDHFYQLPMLGPADNEMFEAYTLLGAVAARTETARLGTLVTGVTYRNPAILAKTVTSLDVISGGRALFGLGAAWHDVEHHALGVDFPSTAERFERLREALEICTRMFRDERPTIEGTHYQVRDAINSPAPISDIPIMIGGQGEKKTLRLVAEYADVANLLCGWSGLAHKVDVLRGHCSDVGRDPGEIDVTMLVTACLGANDAEAEAVRDGLVRQRGVDGWASLNEEQQAMFGERFLVGGPDTVAAVIARAKSDGLTGLAINLPYDGHRPEAVARAGEILSAVL